MREENMTFGQYIGSKRKDSSKGLTLRDVATKLGISLIKYCNIVIVKASNEYIL